MYKRSEELLVRVAKLSSSCQVTQSLTITVIHSLAPPLEAHIGPLEVSASPHGLVRDHAKCMAAKGILDRTDTLCPKEAMPPEGLAQVLSGRE